MVSIGLAISLRYLILIFFSDRAEPFADYQAQVERQWGPIAITDANLVSIGISLVVLVGVALLLQKTRIGKAMRAVSDNRDLAASSGIDVERVIRFVWGLGGGLAALGGVLFGISELGGRVQWEMGFKLLLLMFAGITLGGLGTAYGALLGCVDRRSARAAVDAGDQPRPQVHRRTAHLDRHPGRPASGHSRQPSKGSGDGMDIVRALQVSLAQLIGPSAIFYALLAIGLNLHFGYAGLLNFGQIGFALLGGYGVGHHDRHLRAAAVGRHPRRSRRGRRCWPSSSVSRRCGCGPTTWRSSRSPQPRSCG